MKITFNNVNIDMISEIAKLTLVDTAEAIKTDLIQSQTMPFGETKHKVIYGKKGKYKKNGEKYKGKKIVVYKGGTLQNDSTFVDDSRVKTGRVLIVSDTPYARNMYFHPEYNFNKKQNPNAGGRWFDSYVSGEKKDLPIKYFKRLMQRRMK